MVALIGLLVIVLLSIIAVRIGSVALELTGLSAEVAGFQAQSAFSGVGFTTREAEMIVSHPVRRRIIRILILIGSAGVTTSIATLVLAFVGQSGVSRLFMIEVLVCGLLLIYAFARSRVIFDLMKRLITAALKRWTSLSLYDYEQLFGLSEGLAISKITVGTDSWMSNKYLKDLKLELEGILILAIYRMNGRRREFIGAPHGETMIKAQDVLICYARQGRINKVFSQKNPRNIPSNE
ncbi:MAG: TrkA C-terminal domain-containing protein [Candidatus Omnitrophica bacterium]|nr:TrkA C-terminal domain-containing protein [Candidatus Omnitrophota bacterium]